MLSFVLLSISSVLIITNPLAATLLFVSLTETMEHAQRMVVAGVACRYAFAILFIFAIAGSVILQLFGITLEAFRIAGGLLLFGIGMEMVYAKTSRTKISATEKYESQDSDDVAVMPLAVPMIAGPGAITTVIVLTNEATAIHPVAITIVIASIALSIAITHLMFAHSESIVQRIGHREYRAINRLMGMMLIAIAVQFIIVGVKTAFPLLAGGGA